jgi:hypothetical protein
MTITANLKVEKTLSVPVYTATIRKGPVVLWRKEFKRGTPEFVAYAETQRKAAALTP